MGGARKEKEDLRLILNYLTLLNGRFPVQSFCSFKVYNLLFLLLSAVLCTKYCYMCKRRSVNDQHFMYLLCFKIYQESIKLRINECVGALTTHRSPRRYMSKRWNKDNVVCYCSPSVLCCKLCPQCDTRKSMCDLYKVEPSGKTDENESTAPEEDQDSFPGT
ncbi:hypothetical protein STEG23_036549, partial [Scotinomys teguina]